MGLHVLTTYASIIHRNADNTRPRFAGLSTHYCQVMASTPPIPPTTPLLLLGVVGIFGPVNGYQIRRELLSWQVDKWANVKPGSIYHALGKLSDSGDLIRREVSDGSREVGVYEISESGRARLHRMLEDAVIGVDIFDRSAFHAAFNLLPLLGDERATTLLQQRLVTLQEVARDYATRTEPGANPYAPPHAMEGARLWLQVAQAEVDWLTDVIADVHSGTLSFLENNNWTPPPDDPGHQMTVDRTDYRRILGDQPGDSAHPQQTTTSE